MDCCHLKVRPLGGEIPFSSPVSSVPLVSAHGAVRIREECKTCGRRRWVNVNGVYREEGSWGPTRDQRIVRLTQLQRWADEAYKRALSYSCLMMCPDGRLVEVSVSKNGYVLLTGDQRTDKEDIEIVRRWPGLPEALKLAKLSDDVERCAGEV